MQLSLAEVSKKKKTPSLRLEPKEFPTVVVVVDDDDYDQKISSQNRLEAVLIGVEEAGESKDLPRHSTGVVSTVTIDAGDDILVPFLFSLLQTWPFQPPILALDTGRKPARSQARLSSCGHRGSPKEGQAPQVRELLAFFFFLLLPF